MRFTRGFHAWVLASLGSELGSGLLAFALTWTATGYGAGVAAAVATAAVLPAVLLGLLGGAVADRFGPRRVMIAGELAMIVICSALAVTVAVAGVGPWLLVTVAALVGTVAAFSRPAAGTFPRLFVDDDLLGTAMARVGIAQQVARTTAPALGGMLIGLLTLPGVALLDVVGFLGLLLTLVLIHPPRERSTCPQPGRGATPERVGVHSIVEGVRAARRTGGVPAILVAVAIVAGGVLPTVMLGIPLAARERGWSAINAGWIEACWVAGGFADQRLVGLAGHRGTAPSPDGARPAGDRGGTGGAGVRSMVAGRCCWDDDHRHRGGRLHRTRLSHLSGSRAGIDGFAVPELVGARPAGSDVARQSARWPPGQHPRCREHHRCRGAPRRCDPDRGVA